MSTFCRTFVPFALLKGVSPSSQHVMSIARLPRSQPITTQAPADAATEPVRNDSVTPHPTAPSSQALGPESASDTIRVNTERFKKGFLRRPLYLRGFDPQQSVSVTLEQLITHLELAQLGLKLWVKGSTVNHLYDTQFKGDIDLQLECPPQTPLAEQIARLQSQLQSFLTDALTQANLAINTEQWLDQVIRGAGHIGDTTPVGYKVTLGRRATGHCIDLVIRPDNKVEFDTLHASNIIEYDPRLERAQQVRRVPATLLKWIADAHWVWMQPDISGGLRRLAYLKSKRPKSVLIQPHIAQHFAQRATRSECNEFHCQSILNHAHLSLNLNDQERFVYWRPLLMAGGLIPTPSDLNSPPVPIPITRNNPQGENLLKWEMTRFADLEPLRQAAAKERIPLALEQRHLHYLAVNAYVREQIPWAIGAYPVEPDLLMDHIPQWVGLPNVSLEEILQRFRDLDDPYKLPTDLLRTLFTDTLFAHSALASPQQQLEVHRLIGFLEASPTEQFDYLINRIPPAQLQCSSKVCKSNLLNAFKQILENRPPDEWIAPLSQLDSVNFEESDLQHLRQLISPQLDACLRACPTDSIPPLLLTWMDLVSMDQTFPAAHWYKTDRFKPTPSLYKWQTRGWTACKRLEQALLASPQNKWPPCLRSVTRIQGHRWQIQAGSTQLKGCLSSTGRITVHTENDPSVRGELGPNAIHIFKFSRQSGQNTELILFNNHMRVEGHRSANRELMSAQTSLNAQQLVSPDNRFVALIMPFLTPLQQALAQWSFVEVQGEFKYQQLLAAEQFDDVMDALFEGQLQIMDSRLGLKLTLHIRSGFAPSMTVMASPPDNWNLVRLQIQDRQLNVQDYNSLPGLLKFELGNRRPTVERVGQTEKLSEIPDHFTYQVPLAIPKPEQALATTQVFLGEVAYPDTLAILNYASPMGMLGVVVTAPYQPALQMQKGEGIMEFYIAKDQPLFRWEGQIAGQHAQTPGVLVCSKTERTLMLWDHSSPPQRMSIPLVCMMYRLQTRTLHPPKAVPLQMWPLQSEWPPLSFSGYFHYIDEKKQMSFIGHQHESAATGLLKFANAATLGGLLNVLEGTFVLSAADVPRNWPWGLLTDATLQVPLARVTQGESLRITPHGVCKLSVVGASDDLGQAGACMVFAQGVGLGVPNLQAHPDKDTVRRSEEFDHFDLSRKIDVNLKLKGDQWIGLLHNHAPGVDRAVWSHDKLNSKGQQIFKVHDTDGLKLQLTVDHQRALLSAQWSNGLKIAGFCELAKPLLIPQNIQIQHGEFRFRLVHTEHVWTLEGLSPAAQTHLAASVATQSATCDAHSRLMDWLSEWINGFLMQPDVTAQLLKRIFERDPRHRNEGQMEAMLIGNVENMLNPMIIEAIQKVS